VWFLLCVSAARFVLICCGMRQTSSAFAPVLCISGLIFEALIRLRSALYAATLLPQYRLPGPVISIGNITAGGSGKTPLVIYVAQALSKLGRNPAFLSRGYGRKRSHKTWILPPGTIVHSPARILGDEPALARRYIPYAWMGISKNRFRTGVHIAQKQKDTVFLLDDGFQHRRLYRDLDIVVVDRSQPLQANRVLPRGTLREPVSELRRCHVIVINGMPGKEDAHDPLEAEIRSLHPDALIFRCTQSIRALLPFSLWKESQDRPAPSAVACSAYLVSALGNPERFHRDVRRMGIEVRGTRSFPDHYWLEREDWLACVGEARSKSVDAIITTEKDAVKISQPPDFPLLIAIQSTEVSDARAFEQVLQSCTAGHL
jgi:tetraacyldisaccharide 4'-kinase